MKSLLVLFLSVTFLVLNSKAFEVPKECEGRNSQTVICEDSLSKPNNSIRKLALNVQVLKHLTFLNEKVKSNYNAYKVLEDSLQNIYKTLLPGKNGPENDSAKKEIKKIKGDFDRLTVLSKEILILQKKFNICLNNCSVSRRLELQDDIEALRKIKTAILIKSPILANKIFDSRLEDLDEKKLESGELFSERDFEKDLKSAVFENIAKIENEREEYKEFFNDEKRPFGDSRKEEDVEKYLSELASNYPNVLEDLVESSLLDDSFSVPETTNSACFFAGKFKQYSERKNKKDFAVETGLIFLPMILGPGGAASTLASTERLAVWGIRTEKFNGALSKTSLFSQSGVLLKNLRQFELSEKCKKSHVQFLRSASVNQFNNFKECEESLGEQVYISELGILSAGTLNVSLGSLKYLSKGISGFKPAFGTSHSVGNTDEISNYINKQGLNGLRGREVGVEFKTPDNKVFSVMDLNAVVKSEDTAIREIPSQYWKHVGGVYNDRLNLTENEINEFVQSSIQMSPRTKLIMASDNSPTAGKFKIHGGVGLVHSKNAKEFLPLEKATGVQINRKQGEKVAEIVRLTGGNGADSGKLTSALLSQVGNLILNDKEIKRVFIFTSNTHSRLYRLMGVSTRNMKKINERDVLIELNRTDVENGIEHIKKKMQPESNP